MILTFERYQKKVMLSTIDIQIFMLKSSVANVFCLDSNYQEYIILLIQTIIGSLIKKIGVLLPTRSQLPSSVYILTANPRGSRAVSADPDSPPVK